MPIFITGCARSGTSLTTQVLRAHGVSLGDQASRINSLYENVDVRERVVKPYLRSIQADPLGQNPLPDLDKVKPINNWRGLIEQNMGLVPEPWAYKCAKLVLIWPLWKGAYPSAKYVIVRRDREDIVDSCLRTGFMGAYSTTAGWMGWAKEHENRMAMMKREFPNWIEFWPDKAIADPPRFKPLLDFCGLEFNEKRTEQCINRKKWHRR